MGIENREMLFILYCLPIILMILIYIKYDSIKYRVKIKNIFAGLFAIFAILLLIDMAISIGIIGFESKDLELHLGILSKYCPLIGVFSWLMHIKDKQANKLTNCSS